MKGGWWGGAEGDGVVDGGEVGPKETVWWMVVVGGIGDGVVDGERLLFCFGCDAAKKPHILRPTLFSFPLPKHSPLLLNADAVRQPGFLAHIRLQSSTDLGA